MARPSCSAAPAPANQKFPRTLHKMLDNAERNNIDHIASWLPCGRAFAIHQKQEFFTMVMPIYFPRMKSYKSFRRQLNLYGMYRQEKGNTPSTSKTSLRSEIVRHSGSTASYYSHPLMVRGDLKLCQHITRKQLSANTQSDHVPDHRKVQSYEKQSFPEKESSLVSFLSPHGEAHTSNKAAAMVFPNLSERVPSFGPLSVHDTNEILLLSDFTEGDDTLRVTLPLFDIRFWQGATLSNEEQKDIENEIISTFGRY